MKDEFTIHNYSCNSKLTILLLLCSIITRCHLSSPQFQIRLSIISLFVFFPHSGFLYTSTICPHHIKSSISCWFLREASANTISALFQICNHHQLCHSSNRVWLPFDNIKSSRLSGVYAKEYLDCSFASIPGFVAWR
ncbi:hypothetical protein RchiOBHm_Chr2g0115651 [Rosa chinensis]|uniref:Uncharacterized protein n=1 Tax=Rosa chinensis TaxID=74649 RepID=A0A2P6RR59_ROSCH|nr:hypothetical protein RchiOBHm_Chr2g0115651 [Rosa chinensis]